MTAESEQVDYTHFTEHIVSLSVSFPGTFSFLCRDDIPRDREAAQALKP